MSAAAAAAAAAARGGAGCVLLLEHVRAAGRPEGAPSKAKLLSVVVAPPGQRADAASGFIWSETSNVDLDQGTLTS